MENHEMLSIIVFNVNIFTVPVFVCLKKSKIINQNWRILYYEIRNG